MRASLPAGAGLLLGKGKFEGTGRAWVAGERIVKITAEGKIELEEKDGTVELTFSRTTEFTDVGKAVVEIPTEVKKLFEE